MWTERPPWWASVLIVASAVGLAVLVPVGLSRGRVEPSDGRASASTAAPVSVLVIGDSYTAGSDAGGYGEASWPRLLHLPGTEIEVNAAGGAGYVAAGQGGSTLVSLVQQGVTPGDDVVVFFGATNDVAATGVRAAAERAFGVVRAEAPRARLLVIGPTWPGDDPSPEKLAVRRAVRAAAEDAGADWLDPITDGWFAGSASALIGADGIHPTDAGHVRMAKLIGPHLRKLVRAVR